jgi:hypothetical protein
METTHRIKVKIGDAEFEAEGKPDLVTKQYDEFRAMLAQVPKASSSVSDSSQSIKKSGGGQGRSKLPTAILDAVFRKSDPLSLTDRPKTDNADADALLMLVYGHTEMLGQPDVTAATLAKSARQTGVKSDRIGRSIAAHGDFIKVTGAKKGTRYALNNLGISEAEKLITVAAK